jgi:glycosyltransferase 2 family protein
VSRDEALRRGAALLVSAGALGAVVWWAARQPAPRFPERPRALLELGAAVGVYALATLVRGWRWHTILRALDAGHRAPDAYALVAVGYFGNSVLPARGGEVVRTVLMAQRSRARKRTIAGSIACERALDALSLAVLFVAFTWAGVAGAPLGPVPALVALAGAAAVALALWVLTRRRPAFAERVRPLLGPRGARLAGVSLLVWALEAAIFWIVSDALSLELTLVDAAFLVVLSSFFALIPAAPGYVGTFDAAIVFGLKALHVAGGQAVAFALLARFVLFVPITVVGLALFMGRYGGLRFAARSQRTPWRA